MNVVSSVEDYYLVVYVLLLQEYIITNRSYYMYYSRDTRDLSNTFKGKTPVVQDIVSDNINEANYG